MTLYTDEETWLMLSPLRCSILESICQHRILNNNFECRKCYKSLFIHLYVLLLISFDIEPIKSPIWTFGSFEISSIVPTDDENLCVKAQHERYSPENNSTSFLGTFYIHSHLAYFQTIWKFHGVAHIGCKCHLVFFKMDCKPHQTVEATWAGSNIPTPNQAIIPPHCKYHYANTHIFFSSLHHPNGRICISNFAASK